MRLLKQSTRTQPRVSLILLDWSVRESFHLLHYLSKQDIARDNFEVIILEYYSRVSDAILPFQDQVDTWALLEMPERYYYHKHLMYNAGLVLSKGEVCVVCDSDAMVTPGFIRTIVEAFEHDPNIVLHLDQFRNIRQDFYPFSYPSFEDVLGVGCINNVQGKTKGILDVEDPVHARNYGACMCARREDLIAIGGADEHIDYLGHICGPYDMTFRLVNHGRREVWHESEFMYHTWHPGQAGVDNYLGPHDGRHVSTTAYASFCSGRTLPLLENEAVRRLRTSDARPADVESLLIKPERIQYWERTYVEDPAKRLHLGMENDKPLRYCGHLISRTHDGRFESVLNACSGHTSAVLESTRQSWATLEEAKRSLRSRFPAWLRCCVPLVALYVTAAQVAHYAIIRLCNSLGIARAPRTLGRLS